MPTWIQLWQANFITSHSMNKSYSHINSPSSCHRCRWVIGRLVWGWVVWWFQRVLSLEKSRWGSSIGKKSPESKSIKLVTIVIVIVTGVIIWHRSWSCFKIKIISVFRVIETGLPRCFQLVSLNLIKVYAVEERMFLNFNSTIDASKSISLVTQ